MRLLFTYFFLASLSFSQAQGGFRARFMPPGAGSNAAKAIFEASPGNYFVGGIVYDTLNGPAHNHLTIMGLNSTGQIQWQKNYGNVNFEYLDNSFISRSFYKLGNSFFYTGCVRDSTNKEYGVLIKFNLNGDTLWQKTYKDSIDELVPQMVNSSCDNGFLITGLFENFGGQGRYCLLIKTDANGKELWRKKISKPDLPYVLEGKSVIQDSISKKIIITGYQYIGNPNTFAAYDNILILDSLANNPNHYHLNPGYLFDLVQTKDKKFIGVGCTEVYSPSDNNYYHNSYMVKFDINNPAQPIWKNNIYDQVALINTFSCIKELSGGEVLISGSIDTLKANTKPYVRYIKVNPVNGNVLWRKDYNYLIDSIGNELDVTSLETTSDGGWVVAIRAFDFITRPLFYVKYDSLGCDTSTQWCQSVALGVSEFNKNTGWSFEIFPNPANDLVNFAMDLPSNKTLSLRINDVTGRFIEEININSLSTVLNISSYKAGVYFINIIYEGRSVETKRLLIEK